MTPPWIPAYMLTCPLIVDVSVRLILVLPVMVVVYVLDGVPCVVAVAVVTSGEAVAVIVYVVPGDNPFTVIVWYVNCPI